MTGVETAAVEERAAIEPAMAAAARSVAIRSFFISPRNRGFDFVAVPAPARTRPGRAPVVFPSFQTGSPLTTVSTIPSESLRGSAKVERSMTVAGSKRTRSAFMPGAILPRSASFIREAGSEVILRTASSSVKRRFSRT